jgi:hypothetical protein
MKHAYLDRLLDNTPNNDTSEIANIYNNLLFLGSIFSTSLQLIKERNIQHVVIRRVQPNVRHGQRETLHL